MSDAPVYVGLDYHSHSVQVCILDRDGKVLANRPCKNDWQAITAVVAKHSESGHGRRSRPAPGRPTWPTSWSPRPAGTSTWPTPSPSRVSRRTPRAGLTAAGPWAMRSRTHADRTTNILPDRREHLGGSGVYKGMQDRATARVTGLAGAERGTKTTEVAMFAGWTSQAWNVWSGSSRRSIRRITRPVYPLRL